VRGVEIGRRRKRRRRGNWKRVFIFGGGRLGGNREPSIQSEVSTLSRVRRSDEIVEVTVVLPTKGEKGSCRSILLCLVYFL